MSNPSFSNIDLWLFELAEGNLSPAQIEQLEMFILQHPELDFDRDVWEMARAESKKVTYEEKEELIQRRPIAWYAGSAVAASMILLIGWMFISNNIADISIKSTNENPFDERLLLALKQQKSTQTQSSLQNETTLIEEYVDVVASINTINENSQSNASVFNENLGFNIHRNEALTGNLSANSINLPSIEELPSPYVADNNSENLEAINESSTQKSEIDPYEMISKLDELTVTALLLIDDIDENLKVKELTPVDAPIEEHKLIPIEPSTIDVYNVGDRTLAKSESHAQFSSVNYKESFASKLNRLSRRIQRMMDNPIALKNFKDPTYHVPGMLTNDINMSSTGTMLAPRVQSLSRLQWMNQENEQLINQLAVDGYVYGIRGGVGLQVSHGMYKDGGINVGNVKLCYSPKFSITNSITFEPSVRFTMGNKSLTKSKLESVENVEVDRMNAQQFYPDDQQIIGRNLWYKDLGLGAMVNTEWFFAGIQVDNLFHHKDNIYSNDFANPRRAGSHFITTIGTDWVSRKENLGFSPYVVFQNYESLSEAWVGANLRWNWVMIGAAVSSNLEPAASIGLKFDHFALNYSADYVKSEMLGSNELSHQLTIRFVGKPGRMGRRLLNL